VVLVSSRLGLVCVTPASSDRNGLHPQESRFFRRYARRLPSSLTRDHSSTLACSASLPVSVCGTGTCVLPSRPFSTAQAWFPCGALLTRPLALASRSTGPGFAPVPPYQLGRRSSRRGTCPSASGISQTATTWYRNVYLLSIGGDPLGRPLGPTNPPRIVLAAEPSGFRWWGFAPHFSVTHSGIRTRHHSTRTSVRASTQ
jgi:hypothetical protein